MGRVMAELDLNGPEATLEIGLVLVGHGVGSAVGSVVDLGLGLGELLKLATG